jgi:hypothetical protein
MLESRNKNQRYRSWDPNLVQIIQTKYKVTRNGISYGGDKTSSSSNAPSPSPFVGIRGLVFSPLLASSSTPEVGGMVYLDCLHHPFPVILMNSCLED